MKHWPLYVLFALTLLSILACGGGGGAGSNAPGQVSGVVFDANGNVVRGARVFVQGKETFSNSSGAYVLTGLDDGDFIIRAEIFKNALNFNGQNLAQIFPGERSKNVNIIVVRDTQQARIHGTVLDNFGNVVAGARIFAIGNGFTSNIAQSGPDGTYSLGGLVAGVSYQLLCNGRLYNADNNSVTLAAGDDVVRNFILPSGTNPTLAVPTNLDGIAWTSPLEVTRSTDMASAVQNLKRLIEPRYGQQIATTRSTVGGNPIEVDLYWDPYSSGALLGWGLYRGTSPSGLLSAIEFVRDPNAIFFADSDSTLLEQRTYYYELTALNTQYPDTAQSESGPSNRISVRTMGDLNLLAPTFSPLTFRWSALAESEDYTVFVFNEYPGIGVDPVWSNATTGTSMVYGGPALSTGTRYYYVVVATANSARSRSISIVGDFLAP